MANKTAPRLLGLGIACLSVLLLGCNLPHLFNPVSWDYSKSKPQDSDLAGTYKLLKLMLPSELDRSVRERNSTITLKADHTAVLTDVPEFDGFGDNLVCRLSGSANWALDDRINSGWGWSVVFRNFHPTSKPTSPECSYENSIWGVLVLSRHAPYRLYEIVGG